MKLLFLNSLKGLKKKKIQMLGIILLVMLSTGIYVAMSSALDRMEEKYYNYLEEQNVEYISVDTIIDYKKDIDINDMNYLKENYFKNLTEEENNIINNYINSLNYGYEINPPALIYMIDNIFQKYDADTYIKTKKIGKLQEKYDFEFELDKSKSVKEDETYIKILPYIETRKINKAYLVEGKLPVNENEITILPKFAEIHKIKIGDNYKIGEKNYKVVGFTYAPDYIYPLVSYSAIMFDEKKNNIVYINKENFDEINGVYEKTYSVSYNGDIERKFELNVQVSDDPNEMPKPEPTDMTKIFFDESGIITMNVFTGTRIGRIAALQLEFATDRLFAEYFLYLLLGVAVFVIIIITKKRIEDERLQIGVLKSLGYSPFSIAISYLVYPIIGSIIGGILGYFIGSLFSIPLASMFISYFIIPLGEYKLEWNYLLTSIFVPMILLSILSYLISLFMLRKKPLALLKEGSNLKINIFSRMLNKITSILPFKYRFKYSLAFRSLSKLIVVALTSFFTGMLIVLTLIGMNLMGNLVDSLFNGMDYDYLIYTNTIETEKIDNDSDYMINASLPILEVKDKNDNKKEIEENLKISITGIDQDSKYIKILDKKEKDIKNKLKEDSIIINRNLANLHDIKIGDKLVLSLDEKNTKTIQYNVVDISEEYMNLSGYTDREDLCKKVGYKKGCYSTMFSKNDKYSNISKLEEDKVSLIATILNFKDMRENIETTLKKYNSSIYIIIIFASIMAFVIVAVIANIVVEENKKIISLMKVMGYKNSKISSIVLNIYTPIIIISYFLSIPAMIKLLEKIVSVISGDMEMTIPISLEPSLALLGLFGLLVAYYIAVGLSKKVLNKIPLAVALKRE